MLRHRGKNLGTDPRLADVGRVLHEYANDNSVDILWEQLHLESCFASWRDTIWLQRTAQGRNNWVHNLLAHKKVSSSKFTSVRKSVEHKTLTSCKSKRRIWIFEGRKTPRFRDFFYVPVSLYDRLAQYQVLQMELIDWQIEGLLNISVYTSFAQGRLHSTLQTRSCKLRNWLWPQVEWLTETGRGRSTN
jgi:hypothetical protein